MSTHPNSWVWLLTILGGQQSVRDFQGTPWISFRPFVKWQKDSLHGLSAWKMKVTTKHLFKTPSVNLTVATSLKEGGTSGISACVVVTPYGNTASWIEMNPTEFCVAKSTSLWQGRLIKEKSLSYKLHRGWCDCGNRAWMSSYNIIYFCY